MMGSMMVIGDRYPIKSHPPHDPKDSFLLFIFSCKMWPIAVTVHLEATGGMIGLMVLRHSHLMMESE